MFGQTRMQTMFGEDHSSAAKKWLHKGYDNITTGDITVNQGTKKERFLPYFNETSFYSIEASSIQLSFKRGNCKQKEENMNQVEQETNSDCVYSDWTAWTAASATCSEDGVAHKYRYRVIEELARGNGTACSSDESSVKQSKTVTVNK